MPYGYESRRPPVSPILPIVLVWLGAFLVLGSANSEADDRVQDVQLHNRQIEEALQYMPGVHGVTNLMLDDEDEEFTFHTHDADGRPEDCTGEYEVKNDIARIVADLTCTQTVTVGN